MLVFAHIGRDFFLVSQIYSTVYNGPRASNFDAQWYTVDGVQATLTPGGLQWAAREQL